ncbi:M15 family metallopeptidase [Streptomyces sp. NPDC003038]|uniref:M15 family metallopeptidase n=1 Tax=unclassified Streptomyces TaxID=2593676 RepID=UPI0033A42613
MRAVAVVVAVLGGCAVGGGVSAENGVSAEGEVGSEVGAARSLGADGAAPAGFVALREVDPSIGQDMRYAGERNFTGAVVEGYEEPVCLLARPAAEALRRAQRGLLRRGYSLTVYDCYRPQRAVDRFVRWARQEDGPGDAAVKAEFYPFVERSRLIADGYIAEKSGHSRGSTVDVTLERLAGRVVDMGTPFDYFDPRSHTGDPRITGTARTHRQLLKRVLAEQGFVNLPEEWWHFTYEPEAFPGVFFDFPVSVAAVRP